MSGFRRALRGEIYALLHRRGLGLGLVFVVLGVLLRVLWTRLLLPDLAASGDLQAASRWNFWPRFAEAAGFGFGLTELATLVLVGAALPREIASAAARDPLVRGISRPAFALARGIAAILCPVVLGVAAVTTALTAAAVLYDAGHVVSAPFQLEEDPAVTSAFRSWLAEHELRDDQLAAWLYLMDEEGQDEAAAATRLGLPAFSLPDDYFGLVPVLVFLEEDIGDGVVQALRLAVAPLVALGLFAFLLSMLLPTGSLAGGIATMAVVLFSLFLAPEMRAGAHWVFADGLAGIGHGSALAVARRVADGYTDTVPLDPAVLAAGGRAAWAQAAVFFAAAVALFPRRKL